MNKEYTTRYFVENENVNNDLESFLNKWAADGYELQSIIPYLVEGTTKGYTIVFEKTVYEI